MPDEPEADVSVAGVTATEGHRRHSARDRCRRPAKAVAVALSAVIGILLVLAAIPAAWLQGQLLDTGRYVATVAPLGADPMVQDEVADQVTAAIDERLDLRGRAEHELPPIARPLAGPVGQGVRQVVAQVTTRFTHSTEFERLWVTLNRTAHRQLVAILTGRPAVGGGIRTDPGGRVWLDLGPVIEQVTRKLTAAGLTVAGSMPTVGLRLEVGRVPAADQARTVGRWLDRAATWLPWLAAMCLLTSVTLAGNRRRTIVVVGLGTIAAMLSLRVGLMVTRHAILSTIRPGALSPAIVGHVFDRVTIDVRDTLYTIAFLGGLVATAAFFSQPRCGRRVSRR